MTNNYNSQQLSVSRTGFRGWIRLLCVMFSFYGLNASAQTCSVAPSSAGTASAASASICSGSNTTVTSLGASTNLGVTYQWYSSLVQGGPYSPEVTAATDTIFVTGSLTATTYYVMYAICAAAPDSVISNEVTVTVLPNLPTSVSLGSSSAAVCSGGSMTFTATGVNGGASPVYDFSVNGSSIQTGAGTTYTYVPANGDLVVVSLASNATCATGSPATSNTITVVVNSLPATPTISTSAATICAPGIITFTSSFSGAGNVWTPGGATTDAINASGAGAYSYSVTYTDGNGCTSAASAAATGTIYAANAVAITPSSGSFCGSGVLTSSVVGGNVWSTTATTDAITVSSSNTYSVTNTDVNGCSATASSVITVNSIPAAPSISVSTTPVCAPGTITFTSSSVGGNTWTPGGATTDAITASGAGSYSYTVTYTDGNGCTSAASAAATGTINPANSVSITPASVGFCPGGSATLTSSVVGGNVWSTTEVTDAITVSTGGTYTVTNTNGNGCTATASAVVTANPSPTVSAATNCSSLLAGNSATLTATAPTAVSYQWVLNGTTNVGTSSATYVTAVAGSYTVRVTDANGCTATSAAVVISASGPLAGTYTVGGAVGCNNYTSLANAVSDLNTKGQSASVIFNVAAGYTATAPAGGIIINQCGLSAGLKSSATQTVTFQKSGTGANPVITAPVGTTAGTVAATAGVDGIIILMGADYITFDGINVIESAGNTTATTRMEFGYALLKCSGNDGSNYNTIKNCSISLSGAYSALPSSTAIYSGNHTNANIVQLVYSGAVGTEDASRNGHNLFYGNTITNCYNGFYLVGNASASPNADASGNVGQISLNDTLNYIGFSDPSATTNTAFGNTITSFGGGAVASYGIWEANQRGFEVHNNTMTSAATGSTSTVYGIYAASGVWTNISKNIVTLKNSSTTMYSYYVTFTGGSAANPNIIHVDSNIVQSPILASTHYGFYMPSAGGTGAIVTTSYNTFQGMTGATTTSSVTNYGFYVYPTGASFDCKFNKIINNTMPSAAGGTFYSLYSFPSITGTYTVSNNLSQNNVMGTTTTFYGIYGYNGSGNCVMSNNTITGNTLGSTTGTSYLLYPASTSVNWTIQNNTITNNVKNPATGASGTIYCMYMFPSVGAAGAGDISNNTVSGNTISGVSGTLTATIYGMYCSATMGSGAFNVHDNSISNLSITGTSTSSTAATIYGTFQSISGGVAKIYKNTISGLSNSAAIAGTLYGAQLSSSANNQFYNNTICSIAAGGTLGVARGIQVAGGTTSWNLYNNNITGVTASVANPTAAGNVVMGVDISTTTTTLAVNLYNNTINLSGTGGGTFFGSSGINANTGPKLTLNNNIVINTISPGGSGGTNGATTAFRRSSSTLTSYQATSNNNLFYAGTPGTNNLIYQEANAFTNSKSTLALFKTYVGPTRDAASVTETSTPFISTTCGNANLLHIAATPATIVESTGTPIAMVTTDIDGQTRNASTPDLGSDEGAFTALVPTVLSATFTPTSQCIPVIHTVTAVVSPGPAAISTVTINYSLNGGASTPQLMTLVSGNTYTGDIPAIAGTITYTVTVVDVNGFSTTYNNGSAYADGGITASASAANASVCNGAPNQLSTVVAGGAGNALLLNGSNQYMEVANSATVNLLGNVTLEAWIKPSSFTALGGIISKYQSSSASAYFLRQGNVSPNSGIGAGNANGLETATGLIVLGTWYHVAATFNGTATTIYINGVQVATNPTLGLVTQSSDPLRIGVDFFARYFNGQIDEVRIWNAALSQATLAAWKNSAIISSHPNYASLKAYYNFDELAGTSVTDLSGNGNTGTLMNGATRTASGVPSFAPAYTYSWSPTLGLDNPNISNPVASVLTNTTYTVTVTTANGCSSQASVTANVSQAIPAPIGTPSTQCGLAIPTASVSGAVVYNWYLAPTGGTAIQSATADHLVSYTISTPTTFYVSAFEASTGCESPRTSVFANATTPDAVAASSNLNNVCPGTQLTLTATQTGTTNTYVFTWNGTPAGSGMTSGSIGTPQLVTPTATGTYTYTVTATDAAAGCVTTGSVVVSMLATPVPIAVLATPASICLGQSTTLSTGPAGATSVTYPTCNATSTTDEEIWNVTFGTMNNSSTCATVAPGPGSIQEEYSNYTTSVTPPTVSLGQVVPISYTIGYCGTGTFSNQLAYYIDYNHNGVFTDAGEQAHFKASGTSLLTGTTYTGSITIPNTATTGITRMRVVLVEGTVVSSGTFSWGEAEDYNINIDPNPGATYAWSTTSSVANVFASGQTTTVTPPVAGSINYYSIITGTNGCTLASPTTVAVNPVPTAPNTVGSNQCGSGIPTASVSSTSGMSTPTFIWYTVPTGGTAIQTSTATSLTSTLVTSTTTYYVSEKNLTSTCEGPRAPVTVTVSQPDVITASVSAAPYCLGSPLTLTATQTGTTNTYTYVWTSTAGSGITSPITAQTTPATPTAAGTYIYSVTGTDGSCNYTSTVSVTVSALPTVVAASVSASPVCLGTPVTLTAGNAVGSTSVTYLASNATSTTDEEIWNVTFGSLNNTSTCATLAPGPGSIQEEYSNYTTSVTPPTVSQGQVVPISFTIGYCGTSAFSNMLAYYIDYNHNGSFTDAGEQAFTKAYGVSAFTGTTYTGSITIPNTALGGLTRMRVVLVESSAISSTGTYTWGETEDYNINIDPNPGATYTWSDGTSTIGATNPLTITPTTVGLNNYTAVITGPSGCTVNSTPVTVSVNPLPSAPTTTPSSQCGVAIPTASVSGTSGAIFKWYTVPTGGTAIQSSTATTLTSYTVSTTTTLYVAEYNGTCESPRTPVVISVTQPDPVVATASSLSVCLGDAVTLTANQTGSTNTYSFLWNGTPLAGNGIPGTPVLGPLTTLYNNNFSTSVAPATLAGVAALNTGALLLTPNALSNNGGILIPGGSTTDYLSVDFDMSVLGAGGADGLSYSFGNDVSASSTTPNAEAGTGTKLKVSFDAYGAMPGGQGIYLMYNNNTSNPNSTDAGVLAYSNNNTWVNSANNHVSIIVDAAGLATVTLNSNPIFTNVALPAGYLTSNKATWNHVFKARTGGLSESHSIDNVNIQTKQYLPIYVSGSPIVVTPTIAGTYTYNLTGVDASGPNVCNVNSSVTIVVNPLAPAVNAGSDVVTCEGSNVTLNASGAGLIPALRFTEVLWQHKAGTGASLTIPTFMQAWSTAVGTTMDMLEITNLSPGIADASGVQIELWNATSTTSGLPANTFVVPATASLIPSAGFLFYSWSAAQVNNDVVNNFYTSGAGIDNGSGTSAGVVMRKNGVIIDAVAVVGYVFPAASGVTAADWSGPALPTNSGLSGTVLTGTDNNTSTMYSNTSASLLANVGTLNVGVTATLPSLGAISWTSTPSGFTGSTASATFGPITGTTTFHAQFTALGCSSFDDVVVTTVAPGVIIPTVSATVTAICNSGSSVLTWTNPYQGVSIQWETATSASGPWTVIAGATTASYTTGTLSTVTTYYRIGVTCGIGPIDYSVPTQIVVSVPTILTTTGSTICGAQNATVSATGNGTINWYATSTSTLPIATGNSASIYTAGNTVYWAEASIGTCLALSGRQPALVTVNASTPIVATATPASICLGQSSTISVSSANAGYAFAFNGLGAGNSFLVTPGTTTTYTATAYDATTLCGATADVVVTVNPIPSVPVVTSPATSACVGSTISLSASSTAPGLTAVGTGTVVNSITAYPSPYGQFYGSVHEQYLITAAELAAANIVAGPITSIAFDEAAAYTYTPLANFQMNIAATSATAMTTSLITTGFQNVVPVGTYTPPAATGWATLNFSAPFTWNGTSNIVVDLSFSNCSVCNGTSSCTTAFTDNGSVNQTSTAYASTIDMHADGNCTINTFTPFANGTTTPYVGTTYNQRPNMRFNAVISASGTTTYSWSNGAVGSTVSAVAASLSNTYTVTATSPFGCSSSNSITVAVNPAPTPVLNYTTDQNLCTGVDLNFTVSDLNSVSYPGLFVVDWTPSIVNQSPTLAISSAVLGSPVQARVHTLDNGCSALSNAVNVTYTTVAVSTTTVPASCAGADGSITTTAVGVGPFTYVYSDFAHTVIHTVTNSASSTNTYSGLATGTYYVTVTGNSDGSNTTIPSCPSAEQTVTVGGSTAFTISTVASNESCPGLNNGSATVIIVGGSGNFGIVWSPGLATTSTISPLAPGTYSVQVTDNVSGCVSTTTAVVVAAPLITFNITSTNVTCYGAANGSASVDFTGSAIAATNYAWLDGPDFNTANILASDGDLIGVGPGTYYVYALDGNSCGQYSSAVVITEPAQITVTSFSPTHDVVGASVVITGTGFTGATSLTFNGIPAVTYTVNSATQITAVVPVGATSGTVTVSVGACSGTSTAIFTVDVPTFTTFSLRAFIEGYYIGSGTMNSALSNQGVSIDPTEVDTITVELQDPLNLYTTVETAQAILHTDGTATATFSAAVSGNSYYVIIHHRHAMQTWSAAPVSLPNTPLTAYDFTSGAGQAFGNNQQDNSIAYPGDVTFSLFAGDMNQDGFISSDDVITVDDSNANGDFGAYFATDINGDGFVSSDDVIIVDSNNSTGIFIQTP